MKRRHGTPITISKNYSVVTAIKVVQFGRGHAKEYSLDCGHTIVHIQRNDLQVGSRTRCDVCR